MIKFILKVLGAQIVSIIVLMLTTPLTLLAKDSAAFQYCVSVVMTVFYWAIMCFMLEKSAEYDIKNNDFTMLKPLVAGLVLNLVNIICVIACVVFSAFTNGEYSDQLAILIFRMVNAGYINFMIMLDNPVWLMLVIIAANFATVCFAYYRVKVRHDKHQQFMSNLTKEMEGVHKAVDLPPEDE